MSHFMVWVIGEDIDGQLEPYDESRREAPYKVYLTKKDINRMGEHYKTNDEKELIIRIKDWTCGGGKDNKGLFYMSTYNKNSKWDWFEVGGRWDGALMLKNGGESSEAKVKDIDMTKSQTPFAVVKGGEWFEKGEMGWWGMTFNEKPKQEWGNQVKKLINKLHPSTLITVVDCHI